MKILIKKRITTRSVKHFLLRLWILFRNKARLKVDFKCGKLFYREQKLKTTLYNLHLNNDAAYKKMVYHSCNLRLQEFKCCSLHMFAI